ncbi:MarR family winged helix-turn-helix transcriptional regulator [Oceanicella actignis]|uniref:MarR family winged helix-turn-helix transcriptional regulator n=1 Tax=Oceanicella actignis TaxID=1189325 RepID=UPI0011E7094D|nr:MarR family winged helix-turn-helix transcriptional regulator [Oceanicella actignis]TYO91473.1 DNA-binding MarR family transcriptional regulator [Oceanicella actignis]
MTEFILDDFLPYRLAVLASAASRKLAAIYGAEHGISIPEWRVLCHLSQVEQVSVREIHGRVDMDKSKVSRAAARLAAAGYVRKAPDPEDRRLVALSLTPAGRRLMDEIAPKALAFERRMRAALAPEEAAAFDRALDKLLASLRDAPAEAD